MDKKKFVFVEGGSITFVCDDEGKEAYENIVVIDYDGLPDGTCPVCSGHMESTGSEIVCLRCEYTTNDIGITVIQKYLAYHGEYAWKVLTRPEPIPVVETEIQIIDLLNNLNGHGIYFVNHDMAERKLHQMGFGMRTLVKTKIPKFDGTGESTEESGGLLP